MFAVYALELYSLLKRLVHYLSRSMNQQLRLDTTDLTLSH